jgi:small conductance mechanosensitive channel
MVGSNLFLDLVSIEQPLIFILTLIATVVFAKIAFVLVRRFLDTRISKRVSKLLAQAVQYLIIFSGIYYGVFYVLGYNLFALAASLGIIGIAIAFSAQQVIQNFLAAVLIGVTRTIQIGDWVSSLEVPSTGPSEVLEITLTYTELRSVDGRVYFIANSLLLGSRIVNYSRSGFTEIPVTLKVAAGCDFETVKKIILDSADHCKKILPNMPKEETTAALDVLKIPYVKQLFHVEKDKEVDIGMFMPRVLISNVTKTELTLDIKIWIREIQKKDEIVSEFLECISHGFAQANITLA